jgi:hypothetical protein
MKPGYRPVRTTIVLGGVGGGIGLVLQILFGRGIWAPWAIQGLVWSITAAYCWLLVRWSGRGLGAALFPLLILGGLGVWAAPGAVGLALAPAALSWVRSGVCYPRAAGRALMRETLLCGGGGLLAALLAPSAPLSWAAGLWLFCLVQALFFILCEPSRREGAIDPDRDAFERAHSAAVRLLED